MTFVKNDIIYNELYFVIFIITLILLAILKSKYGEMSKQLVFSIFDKKNSDKFLKRLKRFSLFHTFLYEKIYSVLVTPILIIYFFSSISYNYYLINFFMILLILTILLKLKNVFNLLMNTVGIKTFHIILYLCIAEIIPISLITKGIFY